MRDELAAANPERERRDEDYLLTVISDAMVRIVRDDEVRSIEGEPKMALNFALELLGTISLGIARDIADERGIDRFDEKIIGIFDAATKRSELLLGMVTDIMPHR